MNIVFSRRADSGYCSVIGARVYVVQRTLQFPRGERDVSGDSAAESISFDIRLQPVCVQQRQLAYRLAGI